MYTTDTRNISENAAKVKPEVKIHLSVSVSLKFYVQPGRNIFSSILVSSSLARLIN